MKVAEDAHLQDLKSFFFSDVSLLICIIVGRFILMHENVPADFFFFLHICTILTLTYRVMRVSKSSGGITSLI